MTNNINGIDVSEYFIEVVDEGGSTIDYKILPNSERLLVEKIFEQNQQLKRLQEENNILKQAIKNKNFVAIVKENEELKARLKTLDDEVLTIEITPDEFERYKKCKQALEEIRVFSKNFCEDECPFYENEYSEVCNEACLLDNIVNPILKKLMGC